MSTDKGATPIEAPVGRESNTVSSVSPASYVERLSSLSRQRIQAGIMKVHARRLNTRGFEWRSYYYEAFDVFARQLLKDVSDPELLERLLGEVIPQLIFDEAVRRYWPVFHGSEAPDEIQTVRYGSYWTSAGCISIFKSTLEGSILAWRAKYVGRYGDGSVRADTPQTPAALARSRRELLAEYKRRTGVNTNAAIYKARNSGVHKPEFYRWLTGQLRSTTATARSLETFLHGGERPKPRRPEY